MGSERVVVEWFKEKKPDIIIRCLASVALLVGVFTETGFFTTIFALLVLVALEATGFYMWLLNKELFGEQKRQVHELMGELKRKMGSSPTEEESNE
jgi:hypothetical protein